MSESTSYDTPEYTNSDMQQMMEQFLTKSNVTHMLWFLAIYLIIYFLLFIFYKKTSKDSERIQMGRMLDIMVFSLSSVYILSVYFNTTRKEAEFGVSKNIVIFGEYLDNPFSLFSLICILFAFYLLIYLIQIPMTSEYKPLSISLIENLLIILVTVFLIFDFFKFFFAINFNTIYIPKLLDWWNTQISNNTVELFGNQLYSLLRQNK